MSSLYNANLSSLDMAGVIADCKMLKYLSDLTGDTEDREPVDLAFFLAGWRADEFPLTGLGMSERPRDKSRACPLTCVMAGGMVCPLTAGEWLLLDFLEVVLFLFKFSGCLVCELGLYGRPPISGGGPAEIASYADVFVRLLGGSTTLVFLRENNPIVVNRFQGVRNNRKMTKEYSFT